MNTPGVRTANNPAAAAGAAALRAALRTHAQRHLPEAMVPARFVILDSLPTLPNGKVDRSALPAPQPAQAPATRHTPPRTEQEARIAEVWQEVLGLDDVGVDDDFFALGGDSLSAVRMAARVEERCGLSVSLRRVFDDPTIAGLAATLAPGASAGRPAGDTRSISDEAMLAEAVLPAEIAPEPGAPTGTAPYREVLVTGGSGYTGAFLLRELLDRGEADIHVLVRDVDGDGGADRVRCAMARYGLWRPTDAARILTVAGDLSRPYLGLSRPDYERLASRVDMIVHNGASSNYALPYPRLKPVNVLGTQEVLRFAGARRIKPVHFVSTLGVFPRPAGEPHFAEVEVTQPDGVLGGYRQSKWVGERLVAQAIRRGIPACVYRPGYITGASTNGACAPDTFLSSVMLGCVRLGATTLSDSPLEMVPVDYFAAALASVALSGARHGSWFNMPGAHPMSWDEMFDLIAGCGYPMRRLEYAQWYATLTESGTDNPLARFLPIFDETGMSVDLVYPDCRPVYDSATLDAALAGSGITCPAVDGAVMARYLRYLTSGGGLA